MTLIRLIVLCVSLSSGAGEFINFPQTLYILPDAKWEVKCSSNTSGTIMIFTPQDEIPKDGAILASNADITDPSAAERTRTSIINEYEDATERDEGVYTCLVMHGPGADQPYSLATCFIVVKDLCAEANCHVLDTCKPNLEEGTASCICDSQCYAAKAASTPIEVNFPEILYVKPGTEFALICKGNPSNQVRIYTPREKVPPKDVIVKNSARFSDAAVTISINEYEDATEKDEGVYTCLVMHGPHAKQLYSLANCFVFVKDLCEGVNCFEPETCKPDYEEGTASCICDTECLLNSVMPTTAGPVLDELNTAPVTGAYPVCSIFPGGAIETFGGVASCYDLACHHVLAADILSDGNASEGTYTDPWFIYGTFDVHDGRRAMNGMSFYIGSTIFQIHRGWIVNLEGEKMILEEGVPQQIPSSDCNIVFESLHLILDCPQFTAYYDGVMSGHIKIKVADAGTSDAFGKSPGSFGLCYDDQSGFRKNWQVGNTGIYWQENCEVDTETHEACTVDDANCSGLQMGAKFGGGSTETWGSCGNGARSSCNELYCNGKSLSSAQTCALNQANRINCDLKYGELPAGVVDDGCPEDPCVWMMDIVSRGCPQDYPPFVC